MDGDAQKEQIDDKMKKSYEYIAIVQDKLRDEPEVYYSFLGAVYEFDRQRISVSDLYTRVAKVFDKHQDLFEEFCKYMLTYTRPEHDDDVKTLGPDERSETVLDSAKLTEFASDTSAFFPVNWQAGTSGSISSKSYPENAAGTSGGISSQCLPDNAAATSGRISSQSCPENAVGTSDSSSSQSSAEHSPGTSDSSSSQSSQENLAETYDAETDTEGPFIDGTLYVALGQTRIVDDAAAYQLFAELVNEIKADGVDILNLMKRAVDLLQGYPEMILNFNNFLPNGFKIAIVTSDY